MFVLAASRLKRQGGPQSLHLPKRGTESVDELCFLVGHQRIMAIVASRGHSCRCSGFASACLASTSRVPRCLERIGVVTVEPIGLGVAQDRFECEAGLHLNGLGSNCWTRAPGGQTF